MIDSSPLPDLAPVSFPPLNFVIQVLPILTFVLPALCNILLSIVSYCEKSANDEIVLKKTQTVFNDSGITKKNSSNTKFSFTGFFRKTGLALQYAAKILYEIAVIVFEDSIRFSTHIFLDTLVLGYDYSRFPQF